MQAGVSDFKQSVWKFLENWGVESVFYLTIIYTYLFSSERSRYFYYLFVFKSLHAGKKMMKQGSREARPFWVSAEIQAFECSDTYANPSGHSFTDMGFLLAIWLDYNSSMMQWHSELG